MLKHSGTFTSDKFPSIAFLIYTICTRRFSFFLKLKNNIEKYKHFAIVRKKMKRNNKNLL